MGTYLVPACYNIRGASECNMTDAHTRIALSQTVQCQSRCSVLTRATLSTIVAMEWSASLLLAPACWCTCWRCWRTAAPGCAAPLAKSGSIMQSSVAAWSCSATATMLLERRCVCLVEVVLFCVTFRFTLPIVLCTVCAGAHIHWFHQDCGGGACRSHPAQCLPHVVLLRVSVCSRPLSNIQKRQKAARLNHMTATAPPLQLAILLSPHAVSVGCLCVGNSDSGAGCGPYTVHLGGPRLH